MRKHKAYPEYKDSGVEWLGLVPTHWNVKSINTLVRKIQNGVWGDDPTDGIDDVSCIRVADFNRRNFTVESNITTKRSVPLAHRISRKVEKYDLLLEKSGGGEKSPVGALVQYQGDENAICSNFVAVVKTHSGVNNRWLCYAISHLYESGVNKLSIKQSTGIQNLDSNQYFLESIAIPQDNEQVLIASFLDYTTSKIDSLIEMQTDLIKLLREKRQSIITEAVTKGLNPNVPMKDSGVEWLGEVPEHWDVKPLKHIANQITDKAKTSTLQVGLENIEGWTGLFIKTNSEFTGSGILFSQGDILFGKLRPYLAKAWLADTEGEAVGDFFVIRPISMASDFVHSYVLSKMAIDQLNATTIGAKMPRVSWEDMASLAITIPPIHEQKQIALFVKSEKNRIGAMIEKLKMSIELLLEKRQSIITEAVTGKIDLR